MIGVRPSTRRAGRMTRSAVATASQGPIRSSGPLCHRVESTRVALVGSGLFAASTALMTDTVTAIPSSIDSSLSTETSALLLSFRVSSPVESEGCFAGEARILMEILALCTSFITHGRVGDVVIPRKISYSHKFDQVSLKVCASHSIHF